MVTFESDAFIKRSVHIQINENGVTDWQSMFRSLVTFISGFPKSVLSIYLYS